MVQNDCGRLWPHMSVCQQAAYWWINQLQVYPEASQQTATSLHSNFMLSWHTMTWHVKHVWSTCWHDATRDWFSLTDFLTSASDLMYLLSVMLISCHVVCRYVLLLQLSYSSEWGFCCTAAENEFPSNRILHQPAWMCFFKCCTGMVIISSARLTLAGSRG